MNTPNTVHQFAAQRFVISLLSELAPGISQDGGASITVADPAKKGNYRGRLRTVNGESRIQHTLRGGSVTAFRDALLTACGQLLRAVDNDGALKTGAVPAKFAAEAEKIVSARWTPDVQAHFQFLISDANGKRKQESPFETLGVEVGGLSGIVRTSGENKQALAKAVEKAFTCEACGHVNGKVVDAAPIIAAQKASRTAKSNAVKTAAPAPKVPAKSKK